MKPQNAIDANNEKSKNSPPQTSLEVHTTTKSVADDVSQIYNLPEDDRASNYEQRRAKREEQEYINNCIEEVSRNPHPTPDFLQDDTLLKRWLLHELKDPEHMWTALQGVEIQIGNISRHNGYILVEITRIPPEGKQKHNTLLLEMREESVSLNSKIAGALFTPQRIQETLSSMRKIEQ